jgi:dolichol-phosphate mannosyltransferase
VTEICQDCVGELYELVLVNDGSKDATWQIMQEVAGLDAHVVAVNLSRNYGHQLALSAGLKMCRGDRIFILDADLQDPPELLPQMMAYMDAGNDVVFGERIQRDGETFFKKASARLFYRVLDYLADIEIPKDAGDFRLMSRRAVDILNNMPEHHRFIRGMVSWIGLRQVGLPYHRAARFAGESQYPLTKMISLSIDAITGFSMRPLRISVYFGFCISIVTFILLIYLIIQHFVGHTIEGWTSLAVIVLGLGSIQMLIIGLMGEYLGRLYMEAKGRPLYIIQDVLASPELPAKMQSLLQDNVK